MTFDEVGAPARLSGGPSPATNIPEEPWKDMRRKGGLQRSSSSKNRPNPWPEALVRLVRPWPYHLSYILMTFDL